MHLNKIIFPFIIYFSLSIFITIVSIGAYKQFIIMNYLPSLKSEVSSIIKNKRASYTQEISKLNLKYDNIKIANITPHNPTNGNFSYSNTIQLYKDEFIHLITLNNVKLKKITIHVTTQRNGYFFLILFILSNILFYFFDKKYRLYQRAFGKKDCVN